MPVTRIWVTTNGTNVDNYLPQWDWANSSDLKAWKAIATSIIPWWSNDNIPTEKAVVDYVNSLNVFTAASNPAINTALTTVILDWYNGTVITTTWPANSQAFALPTDLSSWKRFTVVNNDTSTDDLTIVGTSTVTIAPWFYATFLFDGTARTSIASWPSWSLRVDNWVKTQLITPRQVDLQSQNLLNVNEQTFDTTPTVSAHTPWKVYRDVDNETLCYDHPDGGIIQLSQETMDIYTNLSGWPVVNGDIVAIVWASGNRTAVTLCNATLKAHYETAIWMVTVPSIADNNKGRITKDGKIRELNTLAYQEWTLLYVNPANPWKRTATRPVAPNYAIAIWVVDVSHATQWIVDLSIQKLSNICEFVALDTKEPTGFVDNDNITVTGNADRTITLTHPTELAYYLKSVKTVLTSPRTSVAHPNDTQNYFLKSNDWVNFVRETTPREFSEIQVAYALRTGTEYYYLREAHGVTQDNQTHRELHDTIGTYRKSGWTLTWYTLTSTTATNRRPDISATTLYDEDVKTINPQLLEASLYTRLNLTGANSVEYTKSSADIVNLSTNIPYYNLFTGWNRTQALISNNNFMSIRVMAVPVALWTSQAFRYMFVQWQSKSTTLTAQQALSPKNLNLWTLTNALPEFTFTTQIIIRYTGINWYIEEVRDLTWSRALFISTTSWITDHNSTSGIQWGTTGNRLHYQTAPDVGSLPAWTIIWELATVWSEIYSWDGASRVAAVGWTSSQFYVDVSDTNYYQTAPSVSPSTTQYRMSGWTSSFYLNENPWDGTVSYIAATDWNVTVYTQGSGRIFDKNGVEVWSFVIPQGSAYTFLNTNWGSDWYILEWQWSSSPSVIPEQGINSSFTIPDDNGSAATIASYRVYWIPPMTVTMPEWSYQSGSYITFVNENTTDPLTITTTPSTFSVLYVDGVAVPSYDITNWIATFYCGGWNRRLCNPAGWSVDTEPKIIYAVGVNSLPDTSVLAMGTVYVPYKFINNNTAPVALNVTDSLWIWISIVWDTGFIYWTTYHIKPYSRLEILYNEVTNKRVILSESVQKTYWKEIIDNFTTSSLTAFQTTLIGSSTATYDSSFNGGTLKLTTGALNWNWVVLKMWASACASIDNRSEFILSFYIETATNDEWSLKFGFSDFETVGESYAYVHINWSSWTVLISLEVTNTTPSYFSYVFSDGYSNDAMITILKNFFDNYNVYGKINAEWYLSDQVESWSPTDIVWKKLTPFISFKTNDNSTKSCYLRNAIVRYWVKKDWS